MTVHPFYTADSSCFTCAAYCEEVAPTEKTIGRGSCHRHAPRPVHAWTKVHPPRGDELGRRPPPGEVETSAEIVWPIVEDEHFCLEWVPNPRADGKLPTEPPPEEP